MQIVLNHNEIEVAVRQYIEERVSVPEGQRLDIEVLGDDNTITAEINIVDVDAPAGETSSTGSKSSAPRKTRRTKAQIEADAKLEAERQAALTTGKSNDTPTTTASAQSAPVTEPVTVAAAGDTSQNAVQGPGTKEPEVDPSNAVATTVAVVETGVDPELAAELAAASVEEDAAADAEAEPVKEQAPVAEAAEPANEEQPKPTTSLFANLRRPKN